MIAYATIVVLVLVLLALVFGLFHFRGPGSGGIIPLPLRPVLGPSPDPEFESCRWQLMNERGIGPAVRPAVIPLGVLRNPSPLGVLS